MAYEELVANGDPNFPPESRIWRVLYVSTGRDNTERTLVCGLVVAPEHGAKVFDDPEGPRGRVVSWSHGTRGLIPRCLAASDPAGSLWGPTAEGINLVHWSTNADGTGPQGTAAEGILAGMTGAGWIVTASDLYADLWGGTTLEPFIIGKIEAANGIDLVRAAHHLMTAVGMPTGARQLRRGVRRALSGRPLRAVDGATAGVIRRGDRHRRQPCRSPSPGWCWRRPPRC